MLGFPWVVLRRIAIAVATLLASSFVIFSSLYITPGDPIAVLSGGRSLPPETVASLREQYRLDDPFLIRYWDWLWAVLHGDLGQSVAFRQDVVDLIGPRLPTTALLVALASLLIVGGGLALGLLAGLRPGWIDNTVLMAVVIGMAIPSFVAAVVLTSVFAVGLGWFPVYGTGDGWSDSLHHLALPAVALAFSGSAFMTVVTRTSVRGEMNRDHVATAVSRGIPKKTIIRRHVLRNAAPPITTSAGLTVASLVAGTIVVEQAFGINGIGSYLVESVNQKDFPVVQAICLLLVVVYILVIALVDVVNTILDPRIRRGQ